MLLKQARGIYVLMCGGWDSLASSELQEKMVSFSHYGSWDWMLQWLTANFSPRSFCCWQSLKVATVDGKYHSKERKECEEEIIQKKYVFFLKWGQDRCEKENDIRLSGYIQSWRKAMSTSRKNQEQIHQSQFLFTLLCVVYVDPCAPLTVIIMWYDW